MNLRLIEITEPKETTENKNNYRREMNATIAIFSILIILFLYTRSNNSDLEKKKETYVDGTRKERGKEVEK